MPPLISVIADICGIIGFIFSIAIWKMAGRIKAQLMIYQKEQKEIVKRLSAQRDSILLDDTLIDKYLEDDM